MGKIFVCADLHFNHANIIKYENRPFANREEMNLKLIENWNAVVSPGDCVYVLGDVAFAGNTKTSELVHQLNGYKVLIMGNHDRTRSASKWSLLGFHNVYRDPISMRYGGLDIEMMHEPPEGDLVPGHFYLYGHVHGSPDYPDHTDQTACVSIERLGYAPAPLEDVISGKAYEQR